MVGFEGKLVTGVTFRIADFFVRLAWVWSPVWVRRPANSISGTRRRVSDWQYDIRLARVSEKQAESISGQAGLSICKAEYM